MAGGRALQAPIARPGRGGRAGTTGTLQLRSQAMYAGGALLIGRADRSGSYILAALIFKRGLC